MIQHTHKRAHTHTYVHHTLTLTDSHTYGTEQKFHETMFTLTTCDSHFSLLIYFI